MSEDIALLDVGSRGEFPFFFGHLERRMVHIKVDLDAAICQDRSNWGRFKETRATGYPLDSNNKGATIYHRQEGQFDSFFPTNPHFLARYLNPRWAPVSQEWMETRTIDGDMRQGIGIGPHRFISDVVKLDVQGGELRVLHGMVESLCHHGACVITEVSFFQAYETCPLFSEVELFLRNIGFSFFDFLQPRYRSRQGPPLNNQSANELGLLQGRERLFQADALFFWEPHDLIAKSEPTIDAVTRRRLSITSEVARVLGYDDFSAELRETLAHYDNEVPK